MFKEGGGGVGGRVWRKELHTEGEKKKIKDFERFRFQTKKEKEKQKKKRNDVKKRKKNEKRKSLAFEKKHCLSGFHSTFCFFLGLRCRPNRQMEIISTGGGKDIPEMSLSAPEQKHFSRNSTEKKGKI